MARVIDQPEKWHFKCDRCGVTAGPDIAARAYWARFVTMASWQAHPPGYEKPRDLCGDCIKSFEAWFKDAS